MSGLRSDSHPTALENARRGPRFDAAEKRLVRGRAYGTGGG
jgi:hypothetical protein